MSADLLLKLIKRRDLLPKAVLGRLRQQIALQPGDVPPDRVLKLLIDQGFLTLFQAEQLQNELAQLQAEAEAKPGKPTKPALAEEPDELGLAPIEEDAHKKKAPPPASPEPNPAKPDKPAAPREKPTVAKEKPAVPKEKPAAPKEKPAAPAQPPPLSDELSDLFSDVKAEDPFAEVETDISAGDPLMLTKKKKKGLFGLLGGDDETVPAATAAVTSATAAAAPKRGKKSGKFTPKKGRENQWDSPLLLIGGGALFLLIVMGVGIAFLVFRGGSDELFNLAQKDYEAQSYTQAIEKFEKFAKRFDNHPKASLARVRVVLAQIRQSAETNKNWTAALDRSRQLLPTIREEPAFPEARPELAGLLPNILEGLAEQAKSADSTEKMQHFVDLAGQAMQLIDDPDYLPSSLRKERQPRIEEIQGQIDLVRREINREHQLKATIVAIRAAVGKGDTSAAYEARRHLLLQYPTLAGEPTLVQAVAAISAKVAEQVAPLQPTIAPATETEAPAYQAAVVFGSPRGETIAAMQQRDLVVAMPLDGSLWGLEAATGRLRWRYWLDLPLDAAPVPVDVGPLADYLILAGPTGDRLCRVQRATGKIVWTLPLGEPGFRPAIDAATAVVATASGKIYAVDLNDGRPTRAVQLPQPLAAGAGLDAKSNRLFVAAESGNVYALRASDFTCEGVYFTGHDRGQIRTAPIAVRGVGIIGQNIGTTHSLVRTLILAPPPTETPVELYEESGGEAPQPKPPTEPASTPPATPPTTPPAVQPTAFQSTAAQPASAQPAAAEPAAPILQEPDSPIRLEGQFLTEPILLDDRPVVATDRGSLHIFEINPKSTAQPIREVAQTLGTAQEPLAVYLVGSGSQIWAAGRGLTRYDLLAAQGRLSIKWVRDDRCDFLAAPLVVENVLYHLRRRPDCPGAVLAAGRIDQTDARADGTPYWETVLGSPIFPKLDAPSPSVVTAEGDMYPLDAQTLQAGVASAPAKRLFPDLDMLPAQSFSRQVTFAGGRSLLFTQPMQRQVISVDPAQADNPLSVLTLQTPPTAALSEPAALEANLLVPCDDGRVYCLGADGQPSRLPFAPEQTPGETPRFLKPCPIAAMPGRFVVAEASGRVFLVQPREEPRPYFDAAAQVRLSGEILFPPVVLENMVYVVMKGETSPVLVGLTLPELQTAEEYPLPDGVTWGPHALGSQLWLVDGPGRWTVFRNKQLQPIETPPSAGEPVGEPLLSEGKAVFATSQGVLLRIDPETGQVETLAELHRPLAAGPLEQQGKYRVVGRDGALYVIP